MIGGIVTYGDTAVDADAELKTPPTKADDLQHAEFSLELRLKRLSQLERVRNRLKSWERYLVLSPLSDSKESSPKLGISKKRLSQKLKEVRKLLDERKKVVPCEIVGCVNPDPMIPVYKNVCEICFPDFEKCRLPLSDLAFELSTIRNLSNRCCYLENEISCSLANRLGKEELTMALDEADLLDQIIYLPVRKL